MAKMPHLARLMKEIDPNNEFGDDDEELDPTPPEPEAGDERDEPNPENPLPGPTDRAGDDEEEPPMPGAEEDEPRDTGRRQRRQQQQGQRSQHGRDSVLQDVAHLLRHDRVSERHRRQVHLVDGTCRDAVQQGDVRCSPSKRTTIF